jgi:arylsulfatase A-like enzyme
MSLSSDPAVIRFGTPAAEFHEVHGFEHVAPDPAAEPFVNVRRRAELRLRWPEPAPRVALLDLDVPAPPRFPKLRLLLNGRKVALLDLSAGRRRYEVELPAERQENGANVLTFLFGGGASADKEPADEQSAPHGIAARLFSLAVAAPSPALAAIARARLPFSGWAEGDALVQAGPSRLAWALAAPAGARLQFATSARDGEPRFRVEVENAHGERREVWRGGPGRDVAVDLPAAAGDVVRVWLDVDGEAGAPSWGAWKGLAVAGAASPPPPSAASPIVAASRTQFAAANVLLVILDAGGARHFGCYGHPRPTTPNIDRIAAEGVLFERAYTPAVFTLSAMASVWTSQLPDQHHGGVAYDAVLPAAVPTLAEIVSASGITTAAFIGNNMAGTAFGLDRGFSDFYRLSYRAEILREYLHGWLSRNAQRRFLAYVHYREPHFPYDPRPPYDTMFGPDAPLPASAKTDSTWLEHVNDGSHHPTAAELDHLERLYDGNLASVDHEIGLLRQHLESLGLWDRTVVVIAADHGEAMYEHGFIGHNEQVYEESVRIPLIVHFPRGTIPGGRRTDTLASLLDIAPTIAEVVGIPKSRTPSFRGRSLLEAAAGVRDLPPRALLCRTVGPQPHYALVDGHYKYIYNMRGADEQLFDLTRDPGERTDILQAEPVEAAYFRQQLFERLVDLPGRMGVNAPAAVWSIPADQRESLRALGYVK